MKKKITVFGSFVVDLTSVAPRLPIPGETVKGTKFKLGPGGKGSNQAVAAHRANADVTFVTKVGNDVFGQVIRDFYEKEGMNCEYIFEDEKNETGTALIMVDEDSGQNQILVCSGACDNIRDEDIEKTKDIISESDIILLQLEINMDAIEKVINIAHSMGKMIVLNTAPAQKLSDELLKKVDIITPNETEAYVLTDVEIKNEQDAKKAAQILIDKGVEQVIITLGKDGVFVMTPQRDELIESIKVDAIDTTGAGDAFNGGLVTALAENKDIFEAARFGNVVGALSVTKFGTAPAMPHRDEINKFL